MTSSKIRNFGQHLIFKYKHLREALCKVAHFTHKMNNWTPTTALLLRYTDIQKFIIIVIYVLKASKKKKNHFINNFMLTTPPSILIDPFFEFLAKKLFFHFLHFKKPRISADPRKSHMPVKTKFLQINVSCICISIFLYIQESVCETGISTL